MLNIRDLEIYKYNFDKYAITDFYFNKVKVDRSRAITYFCREIHLVDDLKINILVDINILNSKDFTLDLAAKITFIKSCNITIFICTKARRDCIVNQSIYLRKTTIISS